MPASEAQKKNLEKAREERNKHQALLKQVDLLERRIKELGAIGEIYHDEGISFTRHMNQVRTLYNTWPELHAKIVEFYGPSDKEI
jgi:hypothetical protein